ncbi:MAG: glutamate--tRNA ligase [Oscillospiraceae bacterium]|jgi:glutamyl-tRNA synthetase|nr:glutamate--tRNA ligase [Oscillospiraceae bacterium]
MESEIRTRFAPSPTGFMHIGNLRSALYEYLIAKSKGGKFVLRIEDTDQSRLVKNAENVVYETLKLVGMKYDEGPDVGGPHAPYIQSQRKEIYRKKASLLIRIGKAYRCFCGKYISEETEILRQEGFHGYDRRCRNLSESDVSHLLSENKKFVVRQKVPLKGKTTFQDMVFGTITVENSEIEDNILLKSDGFPTYNFANVVDDHEMQITHVVRGCEYLSSTPKYNLLYEAFGWDVPKYVHLPLIMGKNPDGSITKLSKRAGSVSFQDLIKEGFLPESILNYIAFLGWCPEQNREIFTLEELVKEFSIERIGKSSAIFDYAKLLWMNSEHIRLKTEEEFAEIIENYFKENSFEEIKFDKIKIAKILHQRVEKLSDIPKLIDFFCEMPEFEKELFFNKKSKTTIENVPFILENSIKILKNLKNWSFDEIRESLCTAAKLINLKSAAVMWCVRVSVSGKAVTPGGAVEILDILGKEETISRMEKSLRRF